MEKEESESARSTQVDPEHMTFFKLVDDVVSLHRKNAVASKILIGVGAILIGMYISLACRISRLENKREPVIVPTPTHDVRTKVYASNDRQLTAYVKWHDGSMQRFSLRSYEHTDCGTIAFETDSSIERGVKVITSSDNVIILDRSKKK